MSLDPTPKQTLAMWRLLFLGDEPKVSDLGLAPKDRQPLESEGLITIERRPYTDRQGRRAYANFVAPTDRAWAWAAEHLDARIGRSTDAAPILEGLLQRLKVAIDGERLSLADIFLPETPDPSAGLRVVDPPSTPPAPRDIDNLGPRIRSVCLDLAQGQHNVRVRLAALRRRLSDIDRETLNRQLIAMQRDGELVLYPLDDPQEISGTDRSAALSIAGAPRHILYLRPPRNGTAER